MAHYGAHIQTDDGADDVPDDVLGARPELGGHGV